MKELKRVDEHAQAGIVQAEVVVDHYGGEKLDAVVHLAIEPFVVTYEDMLPLLKRIDEAINKVMV